MRKAIFITLVIVLPLMMVGCVSKVLPRVPNIMLSDEAAPNVLSSDTGPISTLAEWEASREALRARFEQEIYGAYPAHQRAQILSHDVLESAAFEGRAQVEQYRLDLSGFETHLVTVIPNDATGPVPTLILQLFCGNRPALPEIEAVAAPLSAHAPYCESGWEMIPTRMIFGENIAEPPIAEILDHGYAIAMIYPGDIVADHAGEAAAQLSQLVPDAQSGAVAAWAWAYSRAVDVLDADARFDPARTAVWGHSRNGKSALLAAVFDPRIDLVIAHQAGTGGTALTRTGIGESVEQITESYPHWFVPSYATYAGHEGDIPIDQHQLIALMAPRPLLIGGAWRDQWSDPQSSFQAARGANPVYALYGSEGLRQAGLADFDPHADLALFMRPGLHGVNGLDWDHFLAFLDAHFSEN
jgi:hypothetical protein